jgi:hypothetical protein
LHDLGADLEAACADGGTQRHAQIVRTRAELGAERAHRRGQHAGHRAAPPGVGGGRGTGARIDDQRRDAVGDEDPDGDAGVARDQRVRFDARDGRRIVARADAHDRGAVNLPRDVERPRDPGRAQQAAPVLLDAGGPVTPARSQVQRVER